MPRVVVAPDKFRGSASAGEVAAAIGDQARRLGWSVDLAPLSDGGEGFCSVLGGRPRPVTVRGPLGEPVESAWFELDGGATAAIEMAMASGLVLAGGQEANDPMRAGTAGVGELMAAAVKAGARRLLVGMGGSASTDGGWDALQVLEPHSRLSGVRIEVACDVRTRFLDAAAVFAPQKGATPAQVEMLGRRLERLAQLYLQRYRVDVTGMDGAGAAGGLAGGLAAVGGVLMSGFEVVSDRIDLPSRIEGADLVITGEGLLDDQSFEGKSVGGVAELGAELGVPVVVIAGDVEGDPDIEYQTLVGFAGEEAAWSDPLGVLQRITAQVLAVAR
ncbi:MAG: glycerate kinase [Acidobacteriota bacterium]|nr:glycerate kinase [Acidobacteriota bacterium]